MKRAVVAILICGWIATPSFANNFDKIQEKLLERVELKIKQSNDNPVAVHFLHQERTCIEKATNINSLADCLRKFSPDKYRTPSAVAER